MSTASAVADVVHASPAARRGRVTQMRLVRSEWTKLRSLRSTRWSLGAAVLAMAGLGPLVAAIQMNRWDHMSLLDRLRFDSIDTGVGGWHLAQLAIGVLGVMVISGEYTTGMIRSSMMAAPRRLPVLWAKLAVFSAATFALALVGSLASFFAVQAIVAQHGVQHSLGDPHALRAVIGAALYLTVLGVMCTGIGALVRSTAGGISLFVFLLFVLPGIASILPSSLADSIMPYLPLSAGTTALTSTHDVGSHHLSTWGGFAVFCGYAAIAVTAAAVGLVRRDV
jgi:ABC-type transport system involved in multi-copper enzyme maturation permease subunit